MVTMQSEPIEENRAEAGNQDIPSTEETTTDVSERSAEVEFASGESDLSSGPPEEFSPEERHARGWTWVLWAILGVLIMALIAAGSAYGGYVSARQERSRVYSTQVSGEAQAQYDMALQDIASKNFDLARQRLEYVISIAPNFPGAADKLTEVLLEQRITATPTNAPTPTTSPTPDTRGRDELFTQAQSMMGEGDWEGAITALLSLRQKYPEHMAIEVDGMLYISLRNRGIDKIAVDADLEGGTYDLTLAERFGPLDAEAKSWRDWAELYIRGASFWDVDWAQAVYFFSQLAPSAPNLRDASGWTATERYLKALVGYGDWLSANGQWCSAKDQYELYLSLIADAQVQPTAEFVFEKCDDEGNQDPTETPTPGAGPASMTTDTPGATGAAPSNTPQPGFNETPTPSRTATPATAYP
jgi:tetratricopeptide (TPR) repeat protein